MNMGHSEDESGSNPAEGLTLVVRRTIAASAARLYDAWTNPEQLLEWWGPQRVRCISADVDLRIGGRYRIGNQLPDGNILWISGVFETIVPRRLLVYSWTVEGRSSHERVTVRFEPRGVATEVTVLHERIADRKTRDTHERGWDGCLSGIARLLESS